MPRLLASFITVLVLLSLWLRSPMLLLLAVLLLLLVGATALWQKYGLSEITYARRFEQDRLFYGEKTTLWVEVTNAKPLPLPWLRAEDELPENLEIEDVAFGRSNRPFRQTLTTLLSLRWYERVRRRYTVVATHRGAYDFGPVTLSTGDLFGFRQATREQPGQTLLLVYPRLVPVTTFNLPAARPGGEYATARRILPDPLRLAGVRDYAPGDSYRHVHWKATARRGQLQTKVFDPSAAHQLVIGANSQTLERHFEGVIPEHFETVMTVAGSVAQAALALRRPVGFFTNSAQHSAAGGVRVPAARHPAQLTRLLETLARLTYFTQQPFERTLRLEASHLPYGASLIIISAVLTDPICAALLDLRDAGHPLTLVVVGTPAPFVPPSLALVGIHTLTVTDSWKTLEKLDLA